MNREEYLDMIPAEYQALVRAWKIKTRRTAEYFAMLAMVTNRSFGGKLEMGDLLPGEDEPE